MIAAATADARKAARRFAKESGGSRVGAIRSASLGYFSISSLDRYTPEIKRVRLVTTIDYAMKDRSRLVSRVGSKDACPQMHAD